MAATSRDMLIHAATGCEDERLGLMHGEPRQRTGAACTCKHKTHLAGKHLAGALRNALAVILDTYYARIRVYKSPWSYARTSPDVRLIPNTRTPHVALPANGMGPLKGKVPSQARVD
jgi:hypothetical protein